MIFRNLKSNPRLLVVAKTASFKMAFFFGVLRLNAASHIISSTLLFETFLFAYLTAALWMQNINIYKTVRHYQSINSSSFVNIIILVYCIFISCLRQCAGSP